MLDTKKLLSLKNRIQRAQSSYGAMGAMALGYELDAMPIDELNQLFGYLTKKRMQYKYLNTVLTKKLLNQFDV